MLKVSLIFSVLLLLQSCTYSMYSRIDTYKDNKVNSHYRFKTNENEGYKSKGRYTSTSSAKTNIDRMIHGSRLTTRDLIRIKNNMK